MAGKTFDNFLPFLPAGKKLVEGQGNLPPPKEAARPLLLT